MLQWHGKKSKLSALNVIQLGPWLLAPVNEIIMRGFSNIINFSCAFLILTIFADYW